MSKYHIFYKLKNNNTTSFFVSSSSSYGLSEGWRYLDAVSTREELNKIIKNDGSADYRVISGTELEWDEEYEEIEHKYTTRVLKSRKPKF